MPTAFILDVIEKETPVVVTTKAISHRGTILAADDKGIVLDYLPAEDSRYEPPVYLTWGYIEWIARAV